ncbi:MAG TPA: gamma-glutamyltransferase family protein [Xanthobacteraceae bacterium]|nr:gamma-glutamyltransferase family protein [Xanthobacteraceae bacterium]
MRDFHSPGRSAVFACDAMAATSHPLASQVAIDALKAGGTAADAAVAAAATLAVVEPHMTGIGGDCFSLVAKPGVPIWGYNGSGRAAAAARADILWEQGVRAISDRSPHRVTVPGAIEAWSAMLETHGRFGLDRALRPAIHYAEYGFPVAPRVAYDWTFSRAALRGDPGASRHFLIDGRAPTVGEVMRFPALAATLKAIATRGPKAFYEEAGAEIVATLAPRGSWLTREDFASHRGEEVTPVVSSYRGLDLVELPPNGQGLVALVLLNVLENFDLPSLDPNGPERLHLALEAARLAYAVRDTHVADPKSMRVSVPSLLDKGFTREIADRIDRRRRSNFSKAPTLGSDTVYLTVVDRDRMVVSFINSLFSEFGARIATEKTGIMLHNRGACFVVDPEHPNAIGPAKRPMHTIIPALGVRDGRCELAFGVMGAHYQPMGHAHLVTNLVDYRMDLQAAIDSPRVFYEDETTIVERGISAATIEGLTQRGHRVTVRERPWGGAQAIAIDWQRGVLIGASDGRKDGCAIGY